MSSVIVIVPERGKAQKRSYQAPTFVSCIRPRGGRTWWLAGRSSRRGPPSRFRASVDSLRGYGSEGWAHFEFTRMNIEPIILRKKIEDLRLRACSSPRGSPVL